MFKQEILKSSRLLDIHTHRMADALQGKAILNYEIPLNGFGSKLMPCFYSTGIHPWTLTEQSVQIQLSALEYFMEDYRLLAIGEAGLDKLTEAAMALQISAFERQVELSELHHLPVVIHCVKAMEELLAVRKRMSPSQPWIWHGFRGKPRQAIQLLENGLYLSFGERFSEEAIQTIPADHLFLETDESKLDIEDILKRVALARSVSTDELRANVQENIQKVFFGCRDF